MPSIGLVNSWNNLWDVRILRKQTQFCSVKPLPRVVSVKLDIDIDNANNAIQFFQTNLHPVNAMFCSYLSISSWSGLSLVHYYSQPLNCLAVQVIWSCLSRKPCHLPSSRWKYKQGRRKNLLIDLSVIFTSS